MCQESVQAPVYEMVIQVEHCKVLHTQSCDGCLLQEAREHYVLKVQQCMTVYFTFSQYSQPMKRNMYAMLEILLERFRHVLHSL